MQKVNVSTWKKEVLESDVPVIVDVFTSYCPPCRALAPVFEKVSGDYTQAKFVKLDGEEEASLAAEIGIRSVPTLLVFSKGKEVTRKKGYESEAALRGWLTSELKSLKG